jgi:hypothetical protein
MEYNKSKFHMSGSKIEYFLQIVIQQAGTGGKPHKHLDVCIRIK